MFSTRKQKLYFLYKYMYIFITFCTQKLFHYSLTAFALHSLQLCTNYIISKLIIIKHIIPLNHLYVILYNYYDINTSTYRLKFYHRKYIIQVLEYVMLHCSSQKWFCMIICTGNLVFKFNLIFLIVNVIQKLFIYE